MYGSLDISTSALVAQRMRLDVISANIAGKDTILNEAGEYEPYRKLIVQLAAGDPARGSTQGVHVSSIDVDSSSLLMKYEPTSPYANAEGYVGYPNVDLVTEQMNAMEAARTYEANIAVIEATKSMFSVALEILG